MTVIDTPEAINKYQLTCLRGAVKLEKLGMKRSVRPSARVCAIQQLGLPFKSTHDDVVAELTRLIEL